MAEILKANGARVPITPANGTDFKLEQMQAIVGGWVDIVYLSGDNILVINDDGLDLGLPVNDAATRLYRHGPIVGDVILCESHQVR